MQNKRRNDNATIALAARASLGSTVHPALAGVLVAIGLVFTVGCEPNARIDPNHEELSVNTIERKDDDDNLMVPHDVQILNAQREILLLNVRQAMEACKIIEDPAAMQGTRAEGLRMLQGVMNELRRLDALPDPNNPRRDN